MVVDRTESISATHSWAWVFAFLLHTCQVTGTLLVYCALRFAFDVRIALETRQAFTGGCIVPRLALGIYTAW